MFLDVKILDTLSVSFPVDRIIDPVNHVLLIPINGRAASILQPGQAYSLIQKAGTRFKVKRQGRIKSVEREKNGIIVET